MGRRFRLAERQRASKLPTSAGSALTLGHEVQTNVALSQGLLSCYSASPTGDWVVAFFTVRGAGVSSRGSMLCKSRVSACGIRRFPPEGKFNDPQ